MRFLGARLFSHDKEYYILVSVNNSLSGEFVYMGHFYGPDNQ